MTVGERVKAARLRKGLTQEELAKKLGYKSRSSVNKIELERDIPRSMIVKLAEILEVTPSYIMGWDTPSEPSNISAVYDDHIRMVPVFESVSAGFGALAENNVVDSIPLTCSKVKTQIKRRIFTIIRIYVVFSLSCRWRQTVFFR